MARATATIRTSADARGPGCAAPATARRDAHSWSRRASPTCRARRVPAPSRTRRWTPTRGRPTRSRCASRRERPCGRATSRYPRPPVGRRAARSTPRSTGARRTLQNPLTFATVDVDRKSGGASVRVSDATGLARVAAPRRGADVQWQHDDRQERAELRRRDRGHRPPVRRRGAARRAEQGPARARDERRPVSARRARALAALLASAGVRADAVHFEVRDHLITATNPDDSGERRCTR